MYILRQRTRQVCRPARPLGEVKVGQSVGPFVCAVFLDTVYTHGASKLLWCPKTSSRRAAPPSKPPATDWTLSSRGTQSRRYACSDTSARKSDDLGTVSCRVQRDRDPEAPTAHPVPQDCPAHHQVGLRAGWVLNQRHDSVLGRRHDMAGRLHPWQVRRPSLASRPGYGRSAPAGGQGGARDTPGGPWKGLRS